VGTFAPNQPKSAIIGYARGNGGPPYSAENIVIISPSVEEKIFKKFMTNLWDQIYIDRKLFETYCRALMADGQVFCRRPCCGKSNTEYKTISDVTLGGCKEVRMVPDIPKAAKEHPMILFHSTDPQHPLYDFMYYNSTDATYHAFQVTTGKTHDAKVLGFKGLRKELGNSSLDFYYLVPEEKFKAFYTTVNVTPAKDDVHTRVWHVLISKP
jgi:hypothetical protein